MASCAITIGGTTGSVVINYTLSATAHTMTAIHGETVYINDAATAITYTTISGNATASSGCVTITSLPITCYVIDWVTNTSIAGFNGFGYSATTDTTFDAILLDTTVVPITSVALTELTPNALTTAINELGDARISAVASKKVTNDDSLEFYIIVQITGTYLPSVRMNATNSHKMYLKGVISADCLPTGYDEIIDYSPIEA